MKLICYCMAVATLLLIPVVNAFCQQAQAANSETEILITSEEDFVHWIGTLGVGINESSGRAVFTHLFPRTPVRMRFTGIPAEVSVAYVHKFQATFKIHTVILSQSDRMVTYNSRGVRDGRTAAVISLNLFIYRCSQTQLGALVNAAQTSTPIDVVGTVSVDNPATANPYGRAPFEDAFHITFTFTPETIGGEVMR